MLQQLLPAFRERYNCIRFIIRSDIYASLSSAGLTTMDYSIRRGCPFYSDWLHHSSTRLGSISWSDINMLTPQTLWAVIGVACTRHLCVAMFADEVLYAFLEFRALQAH